MRLPCSIPSRSQSAWWDLLLANLRSLVADKARCTAEPRLDERLRLAGALVDAELAAAAR